MPIPLPVLHTPLEVPAYLVPSVQGIRGAAMSLPSRTSVGVDAVHPRSFAQLPDAALEALRTLWKGMLSVSAVPLSARGLMVALIPKPNATDPGYRRPIGVLASIVRVLTKAVRKMYGDGWLAGQERDHHFGRQGRTCVQAFCSSP